MNEEQKEIELASETYFQKVQEGLPQAEKFMFYYVIAETEYQAYLAGWFLAKGLPVPEDCRKEVNIGHWRIPQ